MLETKTTLSPCSSPENKPDCRTHNKKKARDKKTEVLQSLTVALISRSACPPSPICTLIKKLGSKYRLEIHSRAGVDVMIAIFCDFCQFSAKKLAFFSKTNAMIKKYFKIITLLAATLLQSRNN
jgi:hypothetical protein